MHRLLIVLVAALLAAVTPTSMAHADASCEAVIADLPVLTNSIQTEWVVQNCSSRTSVRVTLSEFVGGDWERADCDGGFDNCTIVRPTADQDCSDGSLYCAYATLHKTETWNQAGGPCSQQWRTKVTVRNPSGDVIASDASPANTC